MIRKLLWKYVFLCSFSNHNLPTFIEQVATLRLSRSDQSESNLSTMLTSFMYLLTTIVILACNRNYSYCVYKCFMQNHGGFGGTM